MNPDQTPPEANNNQESVPVAIGPDNGISKSAPINNLPTSLSKSPDTSKQSHLAKKIRIVTSVVLILLLGLGAYLINIDNNPAKPKAGSSYTYTTLDIVTTKGTIAGQGSSFSKPTELFEPVKSDGELPQADLYHYEVKDRISSQVAIISSLSTPSTPMPARELNAIKQVFKSGPEYEFYEAATAPMKNIVSSKLASAYDIKYDLAKEFKTANIAEYAWQISFSATKKVQDKTKPTKMEGIVIMVIRKNSTYYFMEAAESNNWKANQKVWQQVAASLKVDQ